MDATKNWNEKERENIRAVAHLYFRLVETARLSLSQAIKKILQGKLKNYPKIIDYLLSLFVSGEDWLDGSGFAHAMAFTSPEVGARIGIVSKNIEKFLESLHFPEDFIDDKAQYPAEAIYQVRFDILFCLFLGRLAIMGNVAKRDYRKFAPACEPSLYLSYATEVGHETEKFINDISAMLYQSFAEDLRKEYEAEKGKPQKVTLQTLREFRYYRDDIDAAEEIEAIQNNQ